jgi:hypothetical protein
MAASGMGMNIARIFECPSHDAPFGKRKSKETSRVMPSMK